MTVAGRTNAVLRAGILRAADDRHVQGFMSRYGMRLGAARFVAGENLDECVTVLRRLADQGLHTNTTLLGESVRDRGEAEAVAGEYGRVLERLHAEKLPCNVALKLTHLGLELDEEVAYANVEQVVEIAERLGSFVRIDMEHRASSTRPSASIAGCARRVMTVSAPCSRRTSFVPSRTSSRCCRSRPTCAS